MRLIQRGLVAQQTVAGFGIGGVQVDLDDAARRSLHRVGIGEQLRHHDVDDEEPVRPEVAERRTPRRQLVLQRQQVRHRRISADDHLERRGGTPRSHVPGLERQPLPDLVRLAASFCAAARASPPPAPARPRRKPRARRRGPGEWPTCPDPAPSSSTRFGTPRADQPDQTVDVFVAAFVFEVVVVRPLIDRFGHGGAQGQMNGSEARRRSRLCGLRSARASAIPGPPERYRGC